VSSFSFYWKSSSYYLCFLLIYRFVEFTHHVHALACLRELNNNTAYSDQYTAGGKQALARKRKGRKVGLKGAAIGEIRIPRLIVDFTVRSISLLSNLICLHVILTAK
jgi:hypothetical protein